jgi:hypothetical protein
MLTMGASEYARADHAAREDGTVRLDECRAWLESKRDAGVKQVRIVSVLRALPEEEARPRRRRVRRPNPSDVIATALAEDPLVGSKEAAELLGVERPRIGRLQRQGVMPEPLFELAAGPVWLQSQVESVREHIEGRRKPTPEQREQDATDRAERKRQRRESRSAA